MSQAKKKRVKIGAVLKGEYGPYIILGNNSTNEKYKMEVAIKVVNAQGEELFKGKNPLLILQDPRTNPYSTDEQKAKIPEKLKYEIAVQVENKE